MKILPAYNIAAALFWSGILSTPSSVESDPARSFMRLLQDFIDFTKDMVVFYIDLEESGESSVAKIQELRETTRREINDIVEVGSLIDVESLERQWKGSLGSLTDVESLERQWQNLLSEHREIADGWLEGFREHFEKIKTFYQSNGKSDALGDVLLTRVLYIILVYDIIKEATKSSERYYAENDKAAYTSMIKGAWKEGGWEGFLMGIVQVTRAFASVLADSTVFFGSDRCDSNPAMNVLVLFEIMERLSSTGEYLLGVIRYNLSSEHGMAIYNTIGKNAAIIMLEDLKYKEDGDLIVREVNADVDKINEDHRYAFEKLAKFQQKLIHRLKGCKSLIGSTEDNERTRKMKAIRVSWIYIDDFPKPWSCCSLVSLSDLICHFGRDLIHGPHQLLQQLRDRFENVPSEETIENRKKALREIRKDVQNKIDGFVSTWTR